MTHAELSLPIRVGDDWWVSSTVGKEAGYLMAEVVKEEDKLMPPVKGWQYGIVGGFFDSDPTLVCSREVSTACREIVVNLYGGAKEKYPELAGIYKPVEGKMNMGRWVGSYKKRKN